MQFHVELQIFLKNTPVNVYSVRRRVFQDDFWTVYCVLSLTFSVTKQERVNSTYVDRNSLDLFTLWRSSLLIDLSRRWLIVDTQCIQSRSAVGHAVATRQFDQNGGLERFKLNVEHFLWWCRLTIILSNVPCCGAFCSIFCFLKLLPVLPNPLLVKSTTPKLKHFFLQGISILALRRCL